MLINVVIHSTDFITTAPHARLNLFFDILIRHMQKVKWFV